MKRDCESAGHFILVGKLYTNITGQKGKVINHYRYTKPGGKIWETVQGSEVTPPQFFNLIHGMLYSIELWAQKNHAETWLFFVTLSGFKPETF